MLPTNQPFNRAADETKPNERRTVIPTPRSNGVFPGWGIRF